VNFDSIPYLLFLGVSVVVYWLIPEKWRKQFLMLCSVLFVAYHHWWFSLLLIAVSLLTFEAGMRISPGQRASRWWYVGSVAILILLLAGFKWSVQWAGADTDFDQISWVLPLGISYYTFQAVSYLTERSWNTLPAEQSRTRFLLYMSFFPKITAGPIERAGDFLPQTQTLQAFNIQNIYSASLQILWGLFKKMVIADRLAPWIEHVFTAPGEVPGSLLTLSILLQAIQVYANFSGYTDIALGSARLFGFELTDNFNRPFLAQNISDFWRRWHITLSKWVLDYIYTPLSFRAARFGKTGIYLSLFLSFIVIGIWHGIEMRYLYFGLMHGTLLVLEMNTRKWRMWLETSLGRAWSVAGLVFTFLFFSMTTLWFFTFSLEEFGNVLMQCMRWDQNTSISGSLSNEDYLTLFFAGTFIPIDHGLFKGSFHRWVQSSNRLTAGIAIICLLICILLFSGVEDIPFIYERF